MSSNQSANSTSCQNQLVERVYRRKNLVATYSRIRLLPPEATAFIRHRDDFLNRRVLDLGCGAGRLAIYLQPIVSRYTGFDISPYMVDHCRAHFPELNFFEGDMRNLSIFEDGSFDAITAISNLFDAVSHTDRLQVLAAVRRVLVPGGLLFFSAHNRNFAKAGEGPRLEWHRNPFTQLQSLIDFGTASYNHHRLKTEQQFQDDYALINDSGSNFASLHYYIYRQTQLQQLTDAGFQTIDCLDSSGRLLTEADDDRDSPSIHYVARSLAST